MGSPSESLKKALRMRRRRRNRGDFEKLDRMRQGINMMLIISVLFIKVES